MRFQDCSPKRSGHTPLKDAYRGHRLYGLQVKLGVQWEPEQVIQLGVQIAYLKVGRKNRLLSLKHIHISLDLADAKQAAVANALRIFL